MWTHRSCWPGISTGAVYLPSSSGTVMLLEEQERQRIRGLIINKFRGDVSILEPGLRMLEEQAGIPVTGWSPYFHLDIDEEDSLTERFQKKDGAGLLEIAVIRLPRISNFTDIAPLEAMEEVNVRYVSSPAEFGSPDAVILPGSKNTIQDLLWMRQNGLEAKILRHASSGGLVFGICGGYQMLGEEVADPFGRSRKGLSGDGALPVRTVFSEEKTRTRVEGRFLNPGGILQELNGTAFEGYEIHMGESVLLESAEAGRTGGRALWNSPPCRSRGAKRIPTAPGAGMYTDATSTGSLTRRGARKDS